MVKKETVSKEMYDKLMEQYHISMQFLAKALLIGGIATLGLFILGVRTFISAGCS